MRSYIDCINGGLGMASHAVRTRLTNNWLAHFNL